MTEAAADFAVRDLGQTDNEAAASFDALLAVMGSIDANRSARDRFDGGDDGLSRPDDPHDDNKFTALDSEQWALALLQNSESPAASDFRIGNYESQFLRGEDGFLENLLPGHDTSD